jgi:hypothetical protein
VIHRPSASDWRFAGADLGHGTAQPCSQALGAATAGAWDAGRSESPTRPLTSPAVVDRSRPRILLGMAGPCELIHVDQQTRRWSRAGPRWRGLEDRTVLADAGHRD